MKSEPISNPKLTGEKTTAVSVPEATKSDEKVTTVQPTKTPITKRKVDINYYINYAKNYALNIDLTYDGDAVEC